jgi:hypothetical protein
VADIVSPCSALLYCTEFARKCSRHRRRSAAQPCSAPVTARSRDLWSQFPSPPVCFTVRLGRGERVKECKVRAAVRCKPCAVWCVCDRCCRQSLHTTHLRQHGLDAASQHTHGSMVPFVTWCLIGEFWIAGHKLQPVCQSAYASQDFCCNDIAYAQPHLGLSCRCGPWVPFHISTQHQQHAHHNSQCKARARVCTDQD